MWDEETGLYYLRSRYYNPTHGRFVNADSILIEADYDKKVVNAKKAHVGIVTIEQWDAWALTHEFTNEIYEDHIDLKEGHYPHFHIEREGRYDKIHIWYYW